MTPELRTKAQAWADADPDAKTKAELLALLEARDLTAAVEADLEDRFAASLEFGTAGLRGVLGAGPNRMNRAVVLRTTWGLAEALLEAVPDVKTRGVLIGRDGRHMSREFAEDTAAVLAAFGIRVHFFGAVVPTPVTAFAALHVSAAAAVMVTASHNPPEYNGYKVYWGNGAQIIPPVDGVIAAHIDRAPLARAVPRMDLDEARRKGIVRDLGDETLRAYLDGVRALEVNAGGDRALSIVYTPLHGVGGDLAMKALAEARFSNVAIVEAQARPDGDFPTVAFPNPEEKGAMDLSFELARKNRAALVLANDPDADRLAVAVPDPSSPSGYRQLTGNQVGVLLGHYLLTEGKTAGAPKRLVINSIVSSPMLGVIARALGVRHEETLTGFKWIANRAMELEKEEGYAFVFGFEEALGYTVGDLVRDKDGVSGAVLAAEIAAVLMERGGEQGGERGRSLLDELDVLYRRYGLFVSSQVTVTKKGATGIEELRAMMDRLRGAMPRAFGATKVTAISDYESRVRTALSEAGAPTTSALTLPRTNMLIFDLEGGSRIIARPSGTEPKVKFYFDVREEVRQGEPMADAEARAAMVMKTLADVFVKSLP